ncbi:tRNA(His) 5'-end guanylyltransferase [Micromonospora pallida]|uniref:tRNA(His) guanylyltransferase n=1 Tax=Micromonospora pallida TaxID=145854 RepID=A0A1C6SUX0_9ACTN|nr:tRNA(His) guanylyltransferase Thg1 family protein [Micromonospora pallida]SCL33053.1 tRNA(His) 5'-end guanylyltransferase [Micromonospora pallida]
MTNTDGLGDRMKSYEQATLTVLPRRTYTIIRVDGRAFHSYLRGAAKPYDQQFMEDMDAVAALLCEEIAGAVIAYTQSDEISVLACDFATAGTQPWFGGVAAKMVSVSAALASAALTRRRPEQTALALFDSRVFTIADPHEVANYFVWRQRDCVRNSITMAAQAQFSHKRLHGVTTGQMQELLWSEKGINWDDYPDGCKRGRVVVKVSGEREVTFTHKRTQQVETVRALRSWWEVVPAPRFTAEVDGFLASTVPVVTS